MIVSKLILSQFKNYSFQEVKFERGFNLLYGINGSGKTNILDAIQYLALTKSHFLPQDKMAIKYGCDFFRLEGFFQHLDQKQHIVLKYQNGSKKLECNDRVIAKNTDHIGQIGIVFIAPDDLDIIDGLSMLRRKFVDSILAQSDHQYLVWLALYKKILEQRNSYLKLTDQPDKVYLQVLNEKMIDAAVYIYQKRLEFSNAFLIFFKNYYNNISQEAETVRIKYDSALHEKSMTELLEKALDGDLRFRTTTKGIHKDDFKFIINDYEVKYNASQGQKKTFLVSLFLAQADYLEINMNQSPILMLDDVFDKLDPLRMQYLLSTLQSLPSRQIILTDTSKERIMKILHSISSTPKYISVKDGHVTYDN